MVKESFENSSHPMSDLSVNSPDQIRSHFDSIQNAENTGFGNNPAEYKSGRTNV
jgi:hypothetical protein